MANRHRKNGTKVKNKRQSPEPHRPKNANFSLVVKLMYRFIQAVHHLNVLVAFPDNALPPALQRKKDELDRFWKPSSSNENVQSKFKKLSKDYMDAGIETMKSHHRETSKDSASKLQKNTLNSEDFDKAKGIATSWAKKNFKRKLSDKTLEDFTKLCNEIASEKTTQENKILASTSKQTSEQQKISDPPINAESQGNNKFELDFGLGSVLSESFAQTPNKRKREVTPCNSPTGDESKPNTNTGDKAPVAKQGKISCPIDDLGPPLGKDDMAKSPGPSRTITEGSVLSESMTRTPIPIKRKRDVTPPNSPSNEVLNTSPSNAPPTKQGKPSSPANLARKSPVAQRFSPKRAFTPYRAESERGQKKKWSLPPINYKTVIIGDSNLSNITKARDHAMHVCSFPGARFSNLTGMLKTLTPYKCVKELVLSIGINERENNIPTTSIPQLKKLIAETKRVFPNAKIHMASLQWNPSRISSKEIKALGELNEHMAKLEDINVLPKLSTDLFKINHQDRYGIHWTKECANAMLESWSSHLN